MKLKVQLTPPERLEKEMLHRWPTLDGYTAHMRELKESWPEWCYVPMSVSLALATYGADEAFAKLYLEQIGTDNIYKLSAIIPWRIEKRIYIFDRTFSRQIQRPHLDADKLISALPNIPAPCVYISEPPGLDECQGVFCFLESQKDRPDTMEVRLHYLFEDDTIVALYAVLNPGRPVIFKGSDEQNKSKVWLCKESAITHMTMLLYLCDDNPDIVRYNPRNRTIDKGGLKVAAYPDIYRVGFEIGGALRKKATEELKK